MPPRAGGAISFVQPTNGASPFTAADFDIDLPVRFSRAELVWRDKLPFLPWADEVVAAGARPNYSSVSFFALEDLLLDVIDTTALDDAKVIDTFFFEVF